jgi:4-carboxymuconolactone decarboxylase
MSDKLPKQFRKLSEEYPQVMAALDALGAAASAGPLPAKVVHLVKLGAAAAMRSEGSVHSHVRRALEGGASPAEVRHALISLISTIGFPQVSASLSWAEDALEKAEKRASKAEKKAAKALPPVAKAASAPPAAKPAAAKKAPAKPAAKPAAKPVAKPVAKKAPKPKGK